MCFILILLLYYISENQPSYIISSPDVGMDSPEDLSCRSPPIGTAPISNPEHDGYPIDLSIKRELPIGTRTQSFNQSPHSLQSSDLPLNLICVKGQSVQERIINISPTTSMSEGTSVQHWQQNLSSGTYHQIVEDTQTGAHPDTKRGFESSISSTDYSTVHQSKVTTSAQRTLMDTLPGWCTASPNYFSDHFQNSCHLQRRSSSYPLWHFF